MLVSINQSLLCLVHPQQLDATYDELDSFCLVTFVAQTATTITLSSA